MQNLAAERIRKELGGIAKLITALREDRRSL